MGRRNPDDPSDVDYHYDPDVAKKNTHSAKQRAAREQDVVEVEKRLFDKYYRMYYSAWFVSFVLIIVSMTTTGWFVSYQELKTLTLAQDVLWRQVDFRMSYEGLQVHIQFCPKMPDGEDNPVSGELKCVLESEGYRSFSEEAFWKPLVGRKKSSPYNAHALQASQAAEALMGLQMFNLLISFVVLGNLTYGIFKTPHRKASLLVFVLHLSTSALGVMANCLFFVNTQPLRHVLLVDNYINEVEPELNPGFSFYIGMVGSLLLLSTGFPFWVLIPYDNGTSEGGTVEDARKIVRDERVKQYLKDRVNSSYQDEVFTESPNPKMKAVPMRPPSKLPPLSLAGGVRSVDAAMHQPGSPLSGPGSTGPNSPFAHAFPFTRSSPEPSTPFGTAPLSPNIRMRPLLSDLVANSPRGPSSPGSASPLSLLGIPLAAIPEHGGIGSSPIMGSMGIGTTAPELCIVERALPSRALPSPFPVNKINTAPKPPSMPVAMNDDEDGDAPSNLVTRKRVVTRIPQFQDMAFRRHLPVGCKLDGRLSNYNVEITEQTCVKGKPQEITAKK